MSFRPSHQKIVHKLLLSKRFLQLLYTNLEKLWMIHGLLNSFSFLGKCANEILSSDAVVSLKRCKFSIAKTVLETKKQDSIELFRSFLLVLN